MSIFFEGGGKVQFHAIFAQWPRRAAASLVKYGTVIVRLSPFSSVFFTWRYFNHRCEPLHKPNSWGHVPVEQ